MLSLVSRTIRSTFPLFLARTADRSSVRSRSRHTGPPTPVPGSLGRRWSRQRSRRDRDRSAPPEERRPDRPDRRERGATSSRGSAESVFPGSLADAPAVGIQDFEFHLSSFGLHVGLPLLTRGVRYLERGREGFSQLHDVDPGAVLLRLLVTIRDQLWPLFMISNSSGCGRASYLRALLGCA